MDKTVGQLIYEITAKIAGGFNVSVKKAEDSIKGVEKQAIDTDKKMQGIASKGGFLRDLFKFEGAKRAFNFLVDFGKQSIQAYANAQQSAIQFNNAMKNLGGSTKEQVNDLRDYIQVLEDKTTVDDKSISKAAQTLAQDQIKIENIKKLLPGLTDLAVANAKYAGTEIDVAETAKQVGLAFADGNLEKLRRQNVAGITDQTAKMFELGDQAQKTAILMKIFEDNAKGAGDALGNSFQGQINRAKDNVEDLQVSVGKGLSVAFNNLAVQLTDTDNSFKAGERTGRGFGVAMTFVSTSVALVGNMIKTAWYSLKVLGAYFVGAGGQAIAFGKDVIGSFKNVQKSILSVGESMTELVKGNFKEAKDKIKDALNLKFDFSNSEQAAKKANDIIAKANEQFNQGGDLIAKNLVALTQSGKIYDTTALELDKLTQAEDAKNKALLDGKKASEEAKQKTEELKKKLEGITEEAIKAGDALEKGLGESYKKYGENIANSIKDTQNKLAEIVVNAEQKKKELQDAISKGGDTTAQQAELAQVQKTLDARVGYEQRAQEQIDAIKKKFADAGLDPNALGLDKQLAGQKTLEEQIAEQKRLASLDEFTRFEEENKAKLLLLAEQAIQELLIQKNKIDTQKKYEQELTDFVLSKNKLKADSVTQFANSAIAKYGEMANALKNVLSLENQVKSGKGGTGLPQFHDGGYVGSQGGQVHAGEFVIPANLVNSMPSLISQLDGLRNGGQTNNISITAGGNTSADFSSVAEELAWRLRRL